MVTNQISVLLVEDHRILRKGLKSLLESEPDFKVVGETGDGVSAVSMAKKLFPQVIVMDLALPKLNGIEASRRILQEVPNSKIVVLSAHADDGYVEKVLSIGVSGYLIKQCSPEFLVEGLRTVVGGKQFFSPSVAVRMKTLGSRQSSRKSFEKKSRRSLSNREVQVLQLIAEGGMNKQISEDLGISIKTVEKHRQNLMYKLAIHDTAGLTRYAISEGIIESSRQTTI